MRIPHISYVYGSADTGPEGIDKINRSFDQIYEALQHVHATSGNPHNVKKEDLGLGRVNNTSDHEKPVSEPQKEALKGKADVSVYDPARIHKNAFDMDNMVEGLTSKILTAVEREAIRQNTLKVSNALHTGDVVGSTALTLSSSSIWSKPTSPASGGGHILFLDPSDNGLKKTQIKNLADASGSMSISDYDPDSVRRSAFDMDNMSEGVNAKILTAPERLQIAQNSAKVTNATHSGDVVGSTTLTIANEAVTLAKMANIHAASFIGRGSQGDGSPEVLSAALARSILNVENGADATSSKSVSGAGGLLSENNLGDLKNPGAARNHLGLGTASTLNAPVGNAGHGEIVTGSDTRLTNERKPSPHKHTALDFIDFSSSVASVKAVATNTAKVTNATHTGDVTGSTSLTIAPGAVTLSKMADMEQGYFICRSSVGDGPPETLSPDGVRSILNVAEGADATSPASISKAGGLLGAMNLSDIESAEESRKNLNVDEAGTDNSPEASYDTPGRVSLATQAEVNVGKNNKAAVTPETLKNFSGLSSWVTLTEGWVLPSDGKIYDLFVSAKSKSAKTNLNSDLLLNGESVLADKIFIGRGEKSTDASDTPPSLISTPTGFSRGDVLSTGKSPICVQLLISWDS